MRQGDAAVVVFGAYNGFDVLPTAKAIGRMENAADGDAVNGNQRGNTAAKIDKSTEGFQVRHSRVNNITGDNMRKIFLSAFQLGIFSGENGLRFSRCIPTDTKNLKADRLIDSRYQRDVTGGAVINADGSLQARDNSLAETQINDQVMVSGAEAGSCFQNKSLFRSLLQSGKRTAGVTVFIAVDPPAFRLKDSHFNSSSLSFL